MLNQEPQYDFFGAMLNLSNAHMKVSEIKKFMDCLKKMDYDMVELYLEDQFEIEGEPYFGYLRGRYSKNELKEIDAYGKQIGMEVIPNIQTLGHLSTLFKNYEYEEYLDSRDMFCVGEPKVYELIEKCIATMRECFTSKYINIGMDETPSIGTGRYFTKHGYREKEDIFLEHLDVVAKICDKYEFTPHIWSDMLYKIKFNSYRGKDLHFTKEFIDRIPENVGLAYWDYYTMEEDVYDDRIQSHLETGRELWFSAGAFGWFGVQPFNTYSNLASKSAMKSVIKNNVKKVMVTLWNSVCSCYAHIPTLFSARQYAKGIFDDQIIKENFYKTFGISYDDMMLLDKPSQTPLYEDGSYPRNTCFCLAYSDVFRGITDYDLITEGHIDFAGIAKEIDEASYRVGEYKYIFDTISACCNYLDVKAELGLRTRDAYKKKDKKALEALLGDYDEAINRLNIYYGVLRTQYMKEYTSYGFATEDAYIGAISYRIADCKKILMEFLNGEREIIEELEEELLPTKLPTSLCFIDFQHLISKRRL